MGGADDGLMEIWEEEGEGIQVDGGGGEKGVGLYIIPSSPGSNF